MTAYRPKNCLMTAAQHCGRAAELRAHNPDSRAAELHELAACAQELAEKVKRFVPSPSIVPDNGAP
jgi:hypothetical protein